MSEYISREELLKHQYRIDDSASLSTRDVVNVEDIADCPSADVRPNIHGHWEEDNGYGLPYHCSICGSGGLKFWNFCRDCGSDMREPKGEKGTE